MTTSAGTAWIVVAVIITALAAMLLVIARVGLSAPRNSRTTTRPPQGPDSAADPEKQRPCGRTRSPSPVTVQRAARAAVAEPWPVRRSPRVLGSTPELGDPSRAAATGIAVGTLALALGVWLTVSAMVLGYQLSDARSDAFLNEAAVAIALGAGGLGRWLSPTRLPRTTVIQGLASAWLITAPFVVGYGHDLPIARDNDVAIGIAGLVLATVAMKFAEHRSKPLPTSAP